MNPAKRWVFVFLGGFSPRNPAQDPEEQENREARGPGGSVRRWNAAGLNAARKRFWPDGSSSATIGRCRSSSSSLDGAPLAGGTSMATLQDVTIQLRRLQQTGFDQMLAQQAQANGFAASFFYAIASRETNCVNELGDVQADGAHGVGIVQIDVQHPIALQARNSGSWQTNPAPLIAFGAQLLAQNIAQVQQALPALTSDQQLKVVASGYNCGVTRAIAAAKAGQDSDVHTTGGNYGADVMARKALF